jgi:MYXO-CTERM domain-containing protein
MRRTSTAAFAVALFAFVLPFATVSCGGLQVDASGADFVLRTPPETTGANAERFDLGALVVERGGGLATAAFLAFACAFLAGIKRWESGWLVFGSLIGLASLLLLDTRSAGSLGGAVDVDARFGAFLAFGAGAAGLIAGATNWLRKDSPEIHPVAPVLGASLIVVGYLYPTEGSAGLSFAYVDTLDLTEPWSAAFWALAVLVGIWLLARRRSVGPSLAGFAVGVLVVVGLEALRDARDLALAPLALLAGILVDVAWVISTQFAERYRPARLSLLAGVAVGLLCWFARP